MTSRWYSNPQLPRDRGWGGWHGPLGTVLPHVRECYRIGAAKIIERVLDPVADEALSHVGKGVVVVQDPEREAFRAGFLAVWRPPSGGLQAGWEFDGPAAADRESEAWEAWLRRNECP